MANNPLLGNRISLISKKNIRYEGTLYSINEADATVALADTRSYGTEGREKLDPNAAYVPPQDVVHSYLLFRGCDIRDLHVHEKKETDTSTQAPPDPAIVSTEAPDDLKARQQKQQQQQQQMQQVNKNVPNTKSDKKTIIASERSNNSENGSSNTPSIRDRSNDTNEDERSNANVTKQNGYNSSKNSSYSSQHKPLNGKKNYYHRNQRQRKYDSQIGTGASLLNRKARGVVDKSLAPTAGKDFDFESSAAEFDKEKKSSMGSGDEDIMIGAISDSAYKKDDFFDSISCDAIDKRDGIDNRLRGAAERNLNTETFGAVSLGNGRRGGRRHRYGRGGRGRGGRHGGRADYGPPSRENTRWKRPDEDNKSSRNNHFSQPPTARAGGER